jgi:hypothetical protein
MFRNLQRWGVVQTPPFFPLFQKIPTIPLSIDLDPSPYAMFPISSLLKS